MNTDNGYMKTVKRNTPQSGFSIIGIIIIVLVVIALLAVVGMNAYKNSPTTKTTEDVEQGANYANSVSLNDFEKVDDPTYTLYYPKGYEKDTPQQNETYRFTNKSSKAVEPEVVRFIKESAAGKKLVRPTYQMCSALGESLRSKADDDIKAEVVSGGIQGGNGVGCKITSVVKVPGGVNDSVVAIAKVLWYENSETDKTLYRVLARYFANASKDEAPKLNAAVDQFALK